MTIQQKSRRQPRTVEGQRARYRRATIYRLRANDVTEALR